MNRLEVRSRELRGIEVHIVSAVGEVDHREAEELRDLIASLAGPTVVDLRECTFMGSDGLRALLEGRQLASDREERLVLAVAPATPPARLLGVVAGETMFNIQGTPHEAITAAGSRSRRAGRDRRTSQTAA